MRGGRKLGIQVWPSPVVMEFMGAKVALIEAATMNFGLEDTLAYYDAAEFSVVSRRPLLYFSATARGGCG